ncbi:CLUMA_CG000316, isoform A [Clunio marinus]|uniref:CLUMA_CG000316, isoform A n=1 Tax=Clunio marinus TaxID=568069 RepID=A0A1J1HJ92_9DIPT|nr:CLUMA_CG000316, isoform A [Clunio marinus]
MVSHLFTAITRSDLSALSLITQDRIYNTRRAWGRGKSSKQLRKSRHSKKNVRSLSSTITEYRRAH